MAIAMQRSGSCAQQRATRSALTIPVPSTHAHRRTISAAVTRSGSSKPALSAGIFLPARQSSCASTLLRAVRTDQATEVTDTAMLNMIADLTKQVDERLAATVAESSAAAATIDATTTSDLRERVVAGIAKLEKGLLERDTEVRSAFGGRRPLSRARRRPALCATRRRLRRQSAHTFKAPQHTPTNPHRPQKRCACCCSPRCAASTCCCSARPAPPSRSSAAA
jgi:hypothetical protein